MKFRKFYPNNKFWAKEYRWQTYYQILAFIFISVIIFCVLYEGSTDFHEMISEDWKAFKQSQPPILFDIMNNLVVMVLTFLRNYIYLWNMRFILLWFPNLNPYIMPWYVLVVMTQPLVDFVRANVPKPMNWDPSYFIGGAILDLLLWYLPQIEF